MTPLPSSVSVSSSIAILLLLIVLPSRCQQYEGEPCTSTDGQGVCKLIQECASVYAQLLAGNPPTQLCGFNGFDPLVCCPQNRKPTTATTSTTSTTTTTTTTSLPVVRPFMSDDPRSVARTMCEEYAKSVYVMKIPPTLTVHPVAVNVSQCGVKTRKLIVGGKKADPKEYPHMVAVGYQGDEDNILWLCGGTLISDRFVLTAAHCTYSTSWGVAKWARIGDLNLASTLDGAKPQDIEVSKRIQHPQYKRPAEYHDIALLKLKRQVEFNEWIRPACLPHALPDVGDSDKATATGWGRVDWADEEGSNDLLKVTLELVKQPKCNESFGGNDSRLKFGIVNDWQICAGSFGKDTCQGDSGGPLVIFTPDQNCMYTVIGVTSLGRLCGSISPGVYTRVYHYVPWIVSVVWPNDF